MSLPRGLAGSASERVLSSDVLAQPGQSEIELRFFRARLSAEKVVMSYTFVVSSDDEDVAYLRLIADKPSGPLRTVRLTEMLSYKGPDVVFDLDEHGRLVGIEIVGP